MKNQLLPERLIKAREKLGITKAEAARRLNLSKIGYCRYEYGERVPSLQMVEMIAQCFGTSSDYLLGNTLDESPDYIVIRKDDSPYLFEIIGMLSSSDQDTQKRILEYYKKLYANINRN